MKLVTLLSAALLMSPLAASDYDALGKTLRQALPRCGTVAVVCDSAHNKPALDAIAGAMSGMKLLVVDVKTQQDMGRALGTLSGRHPDAVVLVAGMHGEFIDVNPVRIRETEEVFHESSGIFERCTEFLEFSPIMRDESPHNLPLLLGYEAVL